MRAVIGAVLALAISACGGTTQSPATPESATAALPSRTAPASASEAPPAATPVTSPAVSGPPVVTAWRKIELGYGPDAREDHTWTLDPSTRTGYLFGGRDGSTVYDDIWAFDLASDTWGEVDSGGRGPAARFGHEAVWVDGVGVVVWAGQAGPNQFFNDLWAYDPTANTWSRLPNDGERPVARYGSCSAIGPDGRLWISHGFTAEGVRFSDTRAYDFDAGRWTDETPDGAQPVVRCLHACWLTEDGRFALYAGQTTGVRALGDMWTLNEGQWAMADGQLPPGRNLPAVTRHGDDAIAFGGLGLDGEYLRDVYRVDGRTLAFDELRPKGARPSGRAGAALIEDSSGGRVLLFGGTIASRALDDTWQLTLP
jgi:hypothetical protein